MQQSQEVMVNCIACTCKVPIGSTIYDKTGTSLICFECYNKLMKGEQIEQYKTIQSSDPDKLKYLCRNCGFKFSRGRTFKFNGLCFNCGKETVTMEQTTEVIVRNRKTLLDY